MNTVLSLNIDEIKWGKQPEQFFRKVSTEKLHNEGGSGVLTLSAPPSALMDHDLSTARFKIIKLGKRILFVGLH